MLATQKPRRTRETTGPTPHSVAIRAKMPSKLPPDHLILERRKQDDQREEAVAVTKYNALCDLKNDWEKITDKRIHQNTVRTRVTGLMQTSEFTLEDRRQRLRDLLAREEVDYINEMEESQETMIERQAKMRERARFLKEKREAERLQVVAVKMDQKWREECEELRATLTRRHMDEVCLERSEQLRRKEQMGRDQKALDDMYADLWEQDRQAKAAREERESQEQHTRNRETLETLQQQKAALEAKREDQRRLKAEEGRLLTEERNLRKLEQERALHEKHLQQQSTRDDLAKNIRLKMKRRAKEMQEELALDMQILEKLLTDTRNEALEISQRKKELREEDQRYRDYLKRELQAEQEREAMIDGMINEEVERQWQKRLNEWAQRRAARRKLLNEVLATRRQQVVEKLATNSEAQEQARLEGESMLASIEEHKRLEDAKNEAIRQDNLGYQQDLLDQVDYSRRQGEVVQDEEHREFLKGLDAEAQYQAKLKEALGRPVIDKVHPMRRAHMERQSSLPDMA